MFKKPKCNIINNYTEKIIINYYKNEYISKEKILHLQECYNKLKKANKFLHITSNLADILTTKNLLCSSGGLGGVLYVTPIDDDFKIHNLGKYILYNELTMFLKNNNLCKDVDSLLVYTPDNKMGYIDYLEFGQWYYYLYKKINNKIEQEQIEKHFSKLYLQIKEITELSTNINNVDKIFEIMNNSNVLKIYIFECILEYLFLFQKNLNFNNMNNLTVKNIIYQLCPSLKIKFSLSNFKVSFNDLNKIIENSNLYETKYIKEYFISRINFFIKKYLLNNSDNMYGHIIFRDFDLRKKLEIEFSRMLWKEAEKSNYHILTYIIPKGEMGILPSYQNIIFTCDVKDDYCFTKEEIQVKICEILVSSGIMRNPYSNKEVDNMELPIKVQGVMYSKVNNKLEYLIIKRCEDDGGFWQGVTGTLEEGEKLKECLVREIKEELGITDIKNISELKQTLQWSKKSGFMITEYVYAVELNKDVDVVLSEEHDDYKWCDFEEAYETLGKDNNKNTLKIVNGELLDGKE